MASISAMSILPMATLGTNKTSFFSPLPVKAVRSNVHVTVRNIKVQASLKENAAVTAAALTASMIIPQVAEAAELVPSLKNFLFSILSGGFVLAAIMVAVIAVSNFDPVKRA